MKRNGSILLLSHIAVNLNLFLMFYHPLRICSVALLQLNPLRGEGAALLSWSRSMALKVRGGQSSSSARLICYICLAVWQIDPANRCCSRPDDYIYLQRYMEQNTEMAATQLLYGNDLFRETVNEAPVSRRLSSHFCFHLLPILLFSLSILLQWAAAAAWMLSCSGSN